MNIQDRIKQRRSQMLVQSYIYYVMNDEIVTDTKWQEWADHLVELQEEHSEPIGFYDVEFEDWDGTTGYHLPHDHWVLKIANRLIYYRDNPLPPMGLKRKRLNRGKRA